MDLFFAELQEVLSEYFNYLKPFYLPPCILSYSSICQSNWPKKQKNLSIIIIIFYSSLHFPSSKTSFSFEQNFLINIGGITTSQKGSCKLNKVQIFLGYDTKGRNRRNKIRI